MNVLTICPCCSSKMLHYISGHREYWFCRHCWSEMPNLEVTKELQPARIPPLASLPNSSVSLKQSSLVG